jgi:hypothetical protein
MGIVLSTSNSAKLEPKRKNRWFVSFDSIPGDGNDGVGSKLSFYAKSGTKPKVTFGADAQVKRLNEKWTFAGGPTWNDLPFTFYDFITKSNEPSAFTIMKNWKKEVYDPLTGMQGYALDYKTNATVAMLDPKGTVIQTFHVFWIWPTDVDYGTVDYTDEGICEVAVNFKYDYAVDGDESTTVGSRTTDTTYPNVV